jgi:hypothetical protein
VSSGQFRRSTLARAYARRPNGHRCVVQRPAPAVVCQRSGVACDRIDTRRAGFGQATHTLVSGGCGMADFRQGSSGAFEYTDLRLGVDVGDGDAALADRSAVQTRSAISAGYRCCGLLLERLGGDRDRGDSHGTLDQCGVARVSLVGGDPFKLAAASDFRRNRLRLQRPTRGTHLRLSVVRVRRYDLVSLSLPGGYDSRFNCRPRPA